MVLNFVLYQGGWLACVLAAAWDVPALGAAVALALILFHLARSPRPARELRLIGAAAAIGAVWDSLLVSAGLVEYHSGILAPAFAPYWIVLMWMLFATTLHSSLAWLQHRLLWAAVLGAVGGPLAYRGAASLGALSLPHTPPALIALAGGWALLTPLMALLARGSSASAEPRHA